MKRTVIITGGTKGIGRAIALNLARQNYNLVLTYVSDDASAEETLAVCRQYTPDVILFKGDIANASDVERLIQATKETFDSIDVLINNAGLNIDKPLHSLTESDWDRVVDTNMKGVFLCSQAASAYMLEQEQGGIILNIGASTGIRGRKNGLNYCASKAGVLIMTKCLAMELAPKIRVNCLIPGMTRTEELEQRFELNNPEKLKVVEAEIPLRRVAAPEEIAEVASFMLSPGAAYINGQKLIVDGGQFMF
jgi:NAD(P)-dependent dehydrogenase (short-subunit alcohol dehydrogenase family)